MSEPWSGCWRTDDACAALTSGTGFSIGHRQAWGESLAFCPGVEARSIHVNDFVVAAEGCRGEFAQCLVDEGAIVNDAGGRCDVTQQVQVLGRRFN